MAPPRLPPQVLVANNERFMVPEALFHPSGLRREQAAVAAWLHLLATLFSRRWHGVCWRGGGISACNSYLPAHSAACLPVARPPARPPADIGMEEAGLAEAIVAAVQAVHPHLHALLYSNVLLTGALKRP